MFSRLLKSVHEFSPKKNYFFKAKSTEFQFLDTQTTDKNNVLFSSRSSVYDCSSFLLSLFVLKIREEGEEVKEASHSRRRS